MPTWPPHPRLLRLGPAQVGQVLAVAAVCWAAGRLGMAVGLTPDMSGVVWPAAGVALAALAGRAHLHLGMGVFLGALANNLNGGMSALDAGAVAMGSTLAAIFGAVALSWVQFSPRLDRLHSVAALALLGALASAVISATCGVGVALHNETHADHPMALMWLAWWLGDAMGVITVAPACLVWGQFPWPRAPWPRLVEGGLLAGLLALLNLALFSQPLAGGATLPPLLYLLLPTLLWAAVRFGQRGASLAILLTTLMALGGTAAGGGPFALGERTTRLVSLQMFLGILAASVLILGAVIEERRTAVLLRDEFMLVASHELKTPLTALRLVLENLQRLIHKDPQSPNVERKLAASQHQVNRLIHLAEDMLDVTRLSRQNGLPLHREKTDLADLVRGVLQRMVDTSQRAGCTVHADLLATPGEWDVERVEQVVTNILDNAFKYGAGQPVWVSVNPHGNQARLQVQDRGIGIRPEDLRRIFERFGRAVPANNYGGLGLSLHISQQIVRAHGGSMGVSSTPQQGACFTVDLPST